MPPGGAAIAARRVLEVSPQGEELLLMLFPHLRGLRILRVEDTGEAVAVWACCRAPSARCPSCGAVSQRVHGGYVRQVADGAAGGRAVLVMLAVRRFRCPDPACAKVTFAEQAEGLSARYRRRSVPLAGMLAGFGLELAGRAGARLAGALGVFVHSSTILRLVMALPDPPAAAAPAVTGVDDFALRKGRVYGTVVADAESGQVRDLLPDREAATLAAWLAAHPGAEVICRDRASAYADGAAAGAPAAVQVADRWHLWHNLGEHAEKAVAAHRGCLPGTAGGTPAGDAPAGQPGAGPDAAPPGPDGPPATATARDSKLDPFKPWIAQRLDQGITDAAALHRELQARGWAGSARTVRRYLRQFRTPGRRAITSQPAQPAAAPRTRQITSWLLARPGSLGADDQARLAAVTAACPHLHALAGHIRAFAAMMTRRQGLTALEDWLAAVEADDQPHLHSFARGIRRDQHAVTAGLALPYSSAAMEGNVNKIKMIKRQMYGRAGFPLLRKRVIHHPR